MEYTFTINTPTGPITKTVFAENETAARQLVIATAYAEDGLNLRDSDVSLQTAGPNPSASPTTATAAPGGTLSVLDQITQGANLPPGFQAPGQEGLNRVQNYQAPGIGLGQPPIPGAGSPATVAPGFGPVRSEFERTPLGQTIGPTTGGLTAQGVFDERARGGNFNDAYRQSLNQVYGDAYGNSSLLQNLFGSDNVSGAYQAAYSINNLDNPQEGSFTNFVAGNTPQDARRAAAEGVLGLLDRGEVNSSNVPNVLDAISSAVGYFGSAYSNIARGRLGRVYDDVQAADAQGGVTSDFVLDSLNRNAPRLIETLRRTQTR